jgi:hypothetical protein
MTIMFKHVERKMLKCCSLAGVLRTSSETSVNFYHSVRRYVAQDTTPYNHRCDDLRFNVLWRIAQSKNCGTRETAVAK